MPRDVPAGLAAHLLQDSTTLCYLFKLERLDGFTIGVTNHDQPIEYDGLTYHPNDGMTPSALESEVGTGVGNMDVMGVLTDDRITEADVDAGLWKNAWVTVFKANWADIADGASIEFYGFIGAVEQGKVSFRAELRGLSQLLKQEVGWETEKTCPNRLGDARCKVPMGGNTVGGTPIRATKTLASGSGLSLTFGSDSAPSGHYDHGFVKFTSGPNAGIERRVKTHTLDTGSAVIVLRTPFPFAVTPGETAQLEAGCNKTWLQCGTKFDNKNNYHGLEQLPSNDKVLKVGRPPG